ncbi:MAG: thioredoxin family protein [Candidatus Bathyarchaeota archaeon]|nr:thioredoxin family protein [Candidatus Bathyarchaeota archaeon]
MIEVDNKRVLNSQLEKNPTVLALFYASWCPYCRNFLDVFDKIVSNRDFPCVLRVNLDDYDNPLWDDYSISAVPTVILFKEGRVCRRLDARLGEGLSANQLKTWLETT